MSISSESTNSGVHSDIDSDSSNNNDKATKTSKITVKQEKEMIRSSRTIRSTSRQPKKSKKQSDNDEEFDDDPFNSRIEYFHAEEPEEEEAEEGEEDEEEEDDDENHSEENREQDDAPGHWSNKDKKTRKICRHFSYDLIDRALRYEWDPEMLCELVHVISRELDFDFTQIKKIIEKTRIGTPVLLAQLADKGTHFTVSELCSILLNASSNMNEFIRLMDDALEMRLINLNVPDTITTLCSFPISNMSQSELIRYAVALCEHCRSKVFCGKVLEQITSKLELQPAAELIADVITLDFFAEIKGTMKECLGQLSRTREEVEVMLDEGYERRSESGDIIESDEDSGGNLRGFIASEGSASEDENDLIEDDEELLSPLPSDIDNEEKESDNNYDDDDEWSHRNEERKKNTSDSFSKNKEQKHKKHKKQDKKDKKEKKHKKDKEKEEEKEEEERDDEKEMNSSSFSGKQERKKRKRMMSDVSDVFEEKPEETNDSNQRDKKKKRLKKNADNLVGKEESSGEKSLLTSEFDQTTVKESSKSSKHEEKESKEGDHSLQKEEGEGEENMQSPASSSNRTRQQRKWLKFREKKKQIKLDRNLETLVSSNVVSYPSDQDHDVLVDSDDN